MNYFQKLILSSRLLWVFFNRIRTIRTNISCFLQKRIAESFRSAPRHKNLGKRISASWCSLAQALFIKPALISCFVGIFVFGLSGVLSDNLESATYYMLGGLLGGLIAVILYGLMCLYGYLFRFRLRRLYFLLGILNKGAYRDKGNYIRFLWGNRAFSFWAGEEKLKGSYLERHKQLLADRDEREKRY